MAQQDPVVAKYLEKMIDADTAEPVAADSGQSVEFSMEAEPDYLLTEGGEISKSHPKVKEIRKLEQEALSLLREQEPFPDEEPAQPKDTTPAVQRAWKQAHEDWDQRRVTYEGDLKERATLLVDHSEHRDVYVVRPAGRPVFHDREYIEIRIPGDKENIVRRPVMPADIAGHRKQYGDWKQGLSQVVSGTPLTQLSGVTKSMVNELAFFHIRTVEQLAATSDGNLSRVGPLLALRKKAQDWVATAKGMAPVEEARNDAKQARLEVEKLKAQMAELMRAQRSQGQQQAAK